jgi:hypothetical protein
MRRRGPVCRPRGPFRPPAREAMQVRGGVVVELERTCQRLDNRS